MNKKIFITTIILCSITTVFSQTQKIEFTAPDAYPEGTAYDRVKNVYYVSSARTGTIGMVSPQGTYSILYADSTLKSSYGMKVAQAQNKLWVCAGDANYSKYTSPETRHKMIRLIGIDLPTGKKVSDIDLSNLVPGEHFANDLTIDDKNNIYITDSYSPVIYKVDTNGNASVFAQNSLFWAAGIGLNGIMYHPLGFLLVANGGRGAVLKVNLNDPQDVKKVMIDQFFPGADGLMLTDNNNLTLVQNQGVNKIFKLTSTDNWQSARVTQATMSTDRFANPATSTLNGSQLWIMNSKFNELADSTAVPSKKFALQLAEFKPVK